MKNLLIVIGFWITVGLNFFNHAGEGETAPFGGSIRESLGENTPAGFNWKYMPSGSFTALPNWNFWNTGRKNPIVKVENLSNLEQRIRSGGIQKNLKSKTQSVDSNLRPRSATLAPRVEARN
ncbi:hypothetical protein AVEN_248564-1 [Araneus ventricosus]|uniref:Uncharacterized protein n=1 Tax=Araneus ventricosus TaxID=182803 RepID=A0A4Y2RUS2_ARAVE|nr:hypothetical protein AVEN_248564-1 [Araneus ventricosus]